MEIKVIEKRTNPLLKRWEIRFKVSHEGATPSREEVKNKLAAMLNAKKELVIIERMRSEYGKRETYGYAKIYKSERRAREIERAHIIQRNAPKTEVEEKPKEKASKEDVRAKPETKSEEG
ncbi:MAG: 30S ribosomal protein S24e [Methanocellales archaeon]|nr:30S ribosomal protein S24e [Methanocellales archaeon]